MLSDGLESVCSSQQHPSPRDNLPFATATRNFSTKVRGGQQYSKLPSDSNSLESQWGSKMGPKNV